MARKYEKEQSAHTRRDTSRQHQNGLNDRSDVKPTRKRSPAPSRHQDITKSSKKQFEREPEKTTNQKQQVAKVTNKVISKTKNEVQTSKKPIKVVLKHKKQDPKKIGKKPIKKVDNKKNHKKIHPKGKSNFKKGMKKRDKLNQDQLDKELDAYWIKGGDTEKAKSNLDQELSEYMKKGPTK